MSGRLMTRVAGLVAPVLLLAVTLLVHGTTPHGHRAGAAVVSAQVWQANPPAQAVGRAPDGHVPDECPQPFDDCDAGLKGAEAPLTCAAASPLHHIAAGLSGEAALLALMVEGQGSPTLRSDRARQDAEQPEPAQSQVYRC
ncbi:hypothetical protein [Actinoallomurus acaciae]|uniref:Uncharacterized protein n=1 Tax=Actinoallomurus acaciae TaxID=502577 RepID=A0ABV5Y9B7_9ACTN